LSRQEKGRDFLFIEEKKCQKSNAKNNARLRELAINAWRKLASIKKC
jgi:hypothetical protein